MKMIDIFGTEVSSMSDKTKVLFICVHNSARSQLAEELLRKYGGDRFSVESAGLTPGSINPDVIEVLKTDENIDISGKKTKSAMQLFKEGKHYHYVITVCNRAEEEGCPIFPGLTKRLSWPFPDPSQLKGPKAERLDKVRSVKTAILNKVRQLIKDPGSFDQK